MLLRFLSALLLGGVCFAAQPNVVFIISDDQGYPDLGCIGSKPLITPNLDKLARRACAGRAFM
jgi:hypothetical protein